MKKDGVKKFFRLTKGKIILTVILTLILIYYVAILSSTCLAGLLIKCPEGYKFYTPMGDALHA